MSEQKDISFTKNTRPAAKSAVEKNFPRWRNANYGYDNNQQNYIPNFVANRLRNRRGVN